MAERDLNDIAEIGVRLIDDAYLAWLAAEYDCGQALRSWCEGSSRHGQGPYAAYRAALDREEAAARDLQRLTDLADPCRLRLVRAAAVT